jgi:cation:H+ antiporter
MSPWLILPLSLAALYFGAEWLVKGSARIAAALGVRPLVIGLTVVAFGTSAPEVFVSAVASWQGQPETALGNVLGSNVANSGLILALAALIRPMKVDLSLLRREGPLLIAVSVALWGVAYTGEYTRWMGGLMLAAMAAFVWASLRWAKSEPPRIEKEFAEFEEEQFDIETRRAAKFRIVPQTGWIVAGLALLLAGGHFLVGSAVALARQFGVSELFIAITLVSVGTSVPELATSMIAAVRGEADISIGNIIGSNIFNLLGVLGVAATVRPIPVAASVRDFEFLWMIGFMVATVIVLRTYHRVTRVEAALLLTGYGVFLAMVV